MTFYQPRACTLTLLQVHRMFKICKLCLKGNQTILPFGIRVGFSHPCNFLEPRIKGVVVIKFRRQVILPGQNSALMSTLVGLISIPMTGFGSVGLLRRRGQTKPGAVNSKITSKYSIFAIELIKEGNLDEIEVIMDSLDVSAHTTTGPFLNDSSKKQG